MAFLLPEAGALIAEVVTDAEIEAIASSALIDATGSEIFAGGAELLTGTTEEGQLFLEPIFDGDAAALNPEDPSILGDLSQASKAQIDALWQHGKAFARWTGGEIMKGAVFQVAFEAVIAVVKHDPPPDLALSDLIQVLSALSDALKILTDIGTEWRRWCVRRYPSRENYGVIIAEGTRLLRFEILRNKLAGLSTYLQKNLAPLLATLKGAISGANIGGIRASLRVYGNMFLALSDDIVQKEHLMVHAGLANHDADIQKCITLLNK